ncbi:MAG: hypothetical protein GY705_06615 [Bacteroidetes bacterium]|nr:hypothetical protein [Bacteroidota bacterium]
MIKSNEKELIGKWIFDGKKILKDEVCSRIEKLISEYLIKINSDKSGWISLFQDPKDSRYWLLTYPEGHMHGGGPPALKEISDLEIQKIFRNENE